MNNKKKKQYEQLELPEGSIEDIAINDDSQNSNRAEEASARLNVEIVDGSNIGKSASIGDSDGKDIGAESLANVNSQTKFDLEFQSP